jgi:hypothetical protein
MQVDEAEEGVVFVLKVDPAPDRSDVVAKMWLAGGLDTAENAPSSVQSNLYLYA